MLRLKVFISCLFLASVIAAVFSGPIEVEMTHYLIALALYLFFTFLYSHLNTIFKKGNVSLEYGISYGLSFGMFAGPLGVFIFEFINSFLAYFQRKRTNTADEDEFLHTFYNTGVAALNHSIGFYLFYILYPVFNQVPFGFGILVLLIVLFINLVSDIYISVVFYFMGEIKTISDAINFMKERSFLDTLKKAVTNGLLFLFLVDAQWEILIGLFILNYIVSRSFMAKQQSIQHKMERDHFEQMAYTDFLTKVPNRAYMNKVMNELNESGEQLGIIVTDIDDFKRVNDTYNHTVGDQAIQYFATKLKSYLHENDYLFRSGGEEFTIILRDRNFHQCEELVHKIKRGIEMNPASAEYMSDRISLNYTASFGMYFYKANKEIDINNAYIHADNLLMQAKNLGKNQIHVRNGIPDLPLSVRYGE